MRVIFGLYPPATQTGTAKSGGAAELETAGDGRTVRHPDVATYGRS